MFLDMVEGVNDEFVYDSWLQVEGDNAISGFRRTRDWAREQHLYFYAEFSKPFKSHTFINKGVPTEEKRVESDFIKAWFDFDTEENEPIVMRIAISAVDVEGAKNNLNNELAANDFDFDALKQKAFDKWNTATPTNRTRRCSILHCITPWLPPTSSAMPMAAIVPTI